MYWEGTMKNKQFQFMIMKFQTKYAEPKQRDNLIYNEYNTERNQQPVISSNNNKQTEQIREAPNIQDLKQQVEIYKSQHDEINDKALSAITSQTWNEMFHSIISSCSLENNFTLEKTFTMLQ